MKIAFVIPSLAKMGPIKVVYELVKEYKKKYEEVCVYYFDNKKGFEFPCKSIKIDFFEKIQFDEYDIIHSHGIRPDAYIWFHKKNIKKSKCVTTLHNYVKTDLANQYNAFVSMIFTPVWNLFTSKHDGVVVLSYDAKKYYNSFWKNRNITVINNGIDPEDNDNQSLPEEVEDKIQLAKKQGMNVIGAIGLLTSIKGFDQLINALSKDSSLFLLLVGDGKEMNNLINSASKLNVESRVMFLGYQEQGSKYFELMDVIAIPSRSEGFPIALLEAARAKKSTICSDIPVFKEILSPNEVSFFELENIESLVSSINNAITNKHHYERNIYKRYFNEYTSKVMSEKHLSLYKEITNG